MKNTISKLQEMYLEEKKEVIDNIKTRSLSEFGLSEETERTDELAKRVLDMGIEGDYDNTIYDVGFLAGIEHISRLSKQDCPATENARKIVVLDYSTGIVHFDTLCMNDDEVEDFVSTKYGSDTFWMQYVAVEENNTYNR